MSGPNDDLRGPACPSADPQGLVPGAGVLTEISALAPYRFGSGVERPRMVDGTGAFLGRVPLDPIG